MAEAIISVALELLANFLIRETSFLYGVREEVERLREEVERLQAELRRMRLFLKYADHKQYDQDEHVRNWVAEIRSIAYDAEDIVDNFLIKAARREANLFSFKKFTSMFKKGSDLCETGNQIRSLRTKLGDIGNSMLTYGFKFNDGGEGSSSTSEMQKRLRRSHPHEEEEDLINLEGCTRDLMAQLMREDDRVRVVPIVGMGGIGKTTLAKKVYSKAEVKRHFDCYSWTFISQQFSVKSILFGILKDVEPQGNGCGKIEEEEEAELILKLYNVLKERLYLVVLDDMWQNEAWDSLKSAFPKGKRGSKILLTTRIKEVALHADPWSCPIELPLLADEESWTLLRNKAFPRDIFGNDYSIPTKLEEIGYEMVRKCGGLPLALVVLAGLLATKKSLEEWEVVHRNMTAQFIKLDQKQHYGGVYGILTLSYHALPWYLKPCFLYFSAFPEDYEIHRKSLVRMWIAEGFVSQPLSEAGNNETLEDVGDEYVEELISRCMIQERREDRLIGRRRGVKICRMHDLMRDICVSKAREENFLEVFDDHGNGRHVMEASFTTTSRRISIHVANRSPQHCLSMLKGNVHLRALLFVPQLSEGYCSLERQDCRLISKYFRLLRVINIGFAAPLTNVPKEIGNLIHLRYLRCRIQGSLPSSIGNLRLLQTLDLRHSTHWMPLPDVLWKLKCLRHLLVDLPQAASCRVDTLRNLETLRWIRAKFLLKKDAKLNLTNLRHLAITFGKNDDVELILKSPILESGHLRSLCMEMPKGCSFPAIIESIFHCHRLSKLELTGFIVQDVHSLFLPQTLSKITLSNSGLKQDPMPILEKLPNLMALRVYANAYRGSQMVCSALGFPKLESLVFKRLLELEEWVVEKGALPRLKTIILLGLDKLKMIPEGLRFVTTLRVLDLRFMPVELTRRTTVIDGVEGDDFHKVQHVAEVRIYQ